MKKWISSAVIYQVNLRALAAREPRNPIEAAKEKGEPELSPLAYLTRNLSTIKKLGVNVLYLMPPYPIGKEGQKGIGSPYSIQNFKAVHDEYGTEDELAQLVRKAHKARMKVIIDITPNHTSRDHVWITAHPDYYVKDDQGGIFFDLDWSDTAKLDYTNPALRREMTAVYDYWLGFAGVDTEGQPEGVDGFRLDMAHFINDLSFWDEAVPQLRAKHAHRELLFLAECYGAANNLDLFSRGINAAYDDDFYKFSIYCYAVNEDGKSVIHMHPDAATHADFAEKYAALKEGGMAAALGVVLQQYEDRFPAGGKAPFLTRYTDNHDEGRGAYRFGDGAVRALNQVIFMSGHCIPFILCGEEFGATNRPSIHERVGPCDKGRRILQADGVRQQEGVEFEGSIFARGHEKRMAWYTFFQELVRMRLKNKEFQRGRFSMLDVGEDCPATERTVIAFERALSKSCIRCAINLGPEPRVLRNTALFEGETIYGGLDGNVLEPFAGVAVRS